MKLSPPVPSCLIPSICHGVDQNSRIFKSLFLLLHHTHTILIGAIPFRPLNPYHPRPHPISIGFFHHPSLHNNYCPRKHPSVNPVAAWTNSHRKKVSLIYRIEKPIYIYLYIYIYISVFGTLVSVGFYIFYILVLSLLSERNRMKKKNPLNTSCDHASEATTLEVEVLKPRKPWLRFDAVC